MHACMGKCLLFYTLQEEEKNQALSFSVPQKTDPYELSHLSAIVIWPCWAQPMVSVGGILGKEREKRNKAFTLHLYRFGLSLCSSVQTPFGCLVPSTLFPIFRSPDPDNTAPSHCSFRDSNSSPLVLTSGHLTSPHWFLSPAQISVSNLLIELCYVPLNALSISWEDWRISFASSTKASGAVINSQWVEQRPIQWELQVSAKPSTLLMTPWLSVLCAFHCTLS